MNISTSSGHLVVVDACDYELLSRFRWSVQTNKSGVQYAVTYGLGKKTYMHRLILGLKDSAMHVDHIDGDGLNNTRLNMRVCSHAENMRNRRFNNVAKSGFRGVWFRSGRAAPWIATVYFNGKKHSRSFRSAELAGAWARSTRAELYGPSARVD